LSRRAPQSRMVIVGAVGLLAGSEVRRRWRATIAIALLVGVIGAVVLATAAGARRSSTALPRFNAASRSSDLEVNVGQPTPEQMAEFAKTPGVAGFARLRGYAFDVESQGLADLALAAPLDGKMGHVVDRARLVAGRTADPSRAQEITVGESLADRLHLKVGSVLRFSTYTQPQIDRAFSNGNPGSAAGPHVEFHVVGIDRRPLDLGVRSTAGGVVVLTPAFTKRWDAKIGEFTDVLRVKTVNGQTDLPAVSAAARRIFGQAQVFGTQGLGIETEGARNAIDVLTLALWIVAGVTAVAGLVAIAIVVTRDVSRSAVDQPTLRGLGLTRGQRIAVSGPRVLLIAGGGALLAVIGGFLLSPLFPFGVARRADPNPGLHADWTVIGPAFLLIVVSVLGLALLSSLRTTRASSLDREQHAYRRTSAIVASAAGSGLRPTALNGLRMAIQSGRGEIRTPVRSAFFGSVFGIAGVTAALVFAASLNHLVATPRLYGWTWDAKLEIDAPNGPCGERPDHTLDGIPGIAGVARVCTVEMQVGDRPVTVWGFESKRGTIDPEVVAGRAPRGPHEIALGAVTMSALHKQIGDTVRAQGESTPARRYHIVGRVVLASIGSPQPLADGAVMTAAGWRPLYTPGGNETDYLAVRARPGARAEVVRAIRALPQDRPPHVKNIVTASPPVEVARLQQVDQIPVSIAALLGVLAILAVGYALVTGVRRRRHELAVLKILGFDRSQVKATVAWQATIIGAVGLVPGVLIGVVTGRLVWQLVAESLGIATDETIPVLWLIVAVPTVLAVVNLIAYFPARAAARTIPAVALRTE
jgi:FtsX-like permease family